MQHQFHLPAQIADLVAARNAVRDYYHRVLRDSGSGVELAFTIDANLIGDIGEALAVEWFGVRLVEGNSTEAVDGIAPDGVTTVQIKATGTGRGPAFRDTSIRADHLLFFDLDLERCTGQVIFNGPENIAFSMLRKPFVGQRSLTVNQIRRAADLVSTSMMLPVLTTRRDG